MPRIRTPLFEPCGSSSITATNNVSSDSTRTPDFAVALVAYRRVKRWWHTRKSWPSPALCTSLSTIESLDSNKPV